MTRWPMVALFTAAMWLGCGPKTATPPQKPVVAQVNDTVISKSGETFVVTNDTFTRSFPTVHPWEVKPEDRIKPVKR